MNRQDRAIQRNKIARLCRHSSKIHRNCIRINTGNTLEHELEKFKLCWRLKKDGQEFITEAVFENGLRADILNLDRGLIFEIVCSEKEESLLEKAETYPLPIIRVFTKNLLKPL